MNLFSPMTIRNLTLKNRIVMSPMCMYSSDQADGHVKNWHIVHYTSRAVGQVGLIIVEATAVTPQGRISPYDLGIWHDEHVPGLRQLTELAHEQGAAIGIQLAHAGRKADVDGPIAAPSAIPFPRMKTPEALTVTQIEEIIAAFRAAAERAIAAGFDLLEIHAAHGYLINQFLSPLTNHRDDDYGGDRDRRYQLLHRIVSEIRAIWSGPLFVRISANEYHPDGNSLDDYVDYAARLKQQGIDLIDCSSGGVVPASIDIYPGYQVPYAARIRKEVSIPTGAVGMIAEPEHAESILGSGQADLIFLARELLRDPYWPRTAAKQLGVSLPAPKQYNRGWI